MWIDLNIFWKTAFFEAWQAFCSGSFPIGAIITNETDQVIVRAHNRNYDISVEAPQIAGTILAHAEMNALLQLQPKRFSAKNFSIYTTCEPCPMCFSSIYMSGIRKIHFAARDFYAGSTNLVGTTPYLSVKPLNIYPPENKELEIVCISIMAFFIYKRDSNSPSPVLDAWKKEFSQVIDLVKTNNFALIMNQLKHSKEIDRIFDTILLTIKDHYEI